MKIYAIFDDSFFRERPRWLPQKLYRVVCQRSNPRTKEYMLNLLKEKFPDAEFIDSIRPPFAEKLILLYPDAIGLGWTKLENNLKKMTSEIMVLNGRKRMFVLSNLNRWKLFIHRFLETTFIPEVLLMPFIFFYGIWIAVKDKVNGCDYD